MESFASIRKHLAMSGIVSQQSAHNLQPFNLKNSATIIVCGLCGVSVAKELDDAKTFEEYTNTFYVAIFAFIITIFSVHMVWMSPKLFKFLNFLEEIINNRM